jgi:hypothetical protein
MKDLGIVLGKDIKGDYSTLAQVRDPDGNMVTLATALAALSTGMNSPEYRTLNSGAGTNAAAR